MGAAKHDCVSIVEFTGECLIEINARDLLRNRMVHPSLFDERNQQRACFLTRLKAASLERFAISVAGDRCFGADDDDFAIACGNAGRVCSRFDDANHGDMGAGGDPIQGKGRCRVAGDDQQLRAMRLQKVRGLDRILGDSFDRLRSVGKACGITEVDVVSCGDNLK